jgi:hypothetical protein
MMESGSKASVSTLVSADSGRPAFERKSEADRTRTSPIFIFIKFRELFFLVYFSKNSPEVGDLRVMSPSPLSCRFKLFRDFLFDGEIPISGWL